MTDPATSASPLQPAFTSDSSPAERLAACKTYLQAETARIQELHRAGESGRNIVAAIAGKMDRLLQPLFDTDTNTMVPTLASPLLMNGERACASLAPPRWKP